MNISSCGIDCSKCKFSVEQNCMGCHEHKGNPFWGMCQLYECAAKKKIQHCGKCEGFPCQKLIDAHKNENPKGNGIEIENLKKLVGLEK